MKKQLKVFLLFFAILIYSERTSATETGCQIGVQIYTNKTNPGFLNAILGSTPIYQGNGRITVAQQCISNQRGPCRVCTGSFTSLYGLISGCTTGFVQGTEVDYIVNCDLDKNTLALVLFGGITGFWFLSRKKI
ncbi:MAG: hypothetical protein EOO90_09315 [Pedobacter sp.]|nr:MAG: hypothetical protein EOO90_09315 [Pedobacter sp.]